ncbi:monocarboxylate transporter 7-like, partial [Asbolus verrucosus]
MWMGMTGSDDYWLFVPAGISSGLGASILLVQCEILLAQYFKLKLPVLHQISQFVVTLGFLIAPVALGHYILNTTISQVLLWYQAIILQGLVVGLFFRKPLYLKSKKQKPYQFVSMNPDDEEDIFSKNSRELQIKRQTSTESHMSKIQINNNEPQPSTSSNNNDPKRKQWENFEEEDDDVKYDKLNDWEVFDDEEDDVPKKQNWERFDNDESPTPRIVNELSLAEETKNEQNNIAPRPLFSDFPVNNNNTYAYDDEIVAETANTNVFMPNNSNSDDIKRRLDLLKEPTFYKSLLMVIANTYSSFVFYTLFPSYLYIEADSVNIRHMTGLVGALSLVNLVFLSICYWIKIDKKKRPVYFWIFYWIGSVGYFMIADFTNEYVLLIGAIQVVLSIGVLEHTAKPLLGISPRGETSNEYSMLTTLSGLTLFLFLFIDATFRTCFRLMAVLHFFTGTLWLSNFVYKKLRMEIILELISTQNVQQTPAFVTASLQTKRVLEVFNQHLIQKSSN